ncbi:MAG: hypothetical protein JRI72_12145 [Deltaproteobacteria bacterium]|nr:hypothetical protein [Deltaproteobacteria bacterium]
MPNEVNCPVCKKGYKPKLGNIPKKGWFHCPYCGHTDRIINSIKSLPEDRPLPMRPYAIEGYCKTCAGDVYKEVDSQQIKLDGTYSKLKIQDPRLPDHPCLITKNNGKFFKGITPADVARYQRACEIWEKEKGNMPYPKQSIPDGQETHRLIRHHYFYWYQMFNPRQLLCLSTLLRAIDEEEDQVLKEMLLSAFCSALESYNLFTRYRHDSDKTEGVFARQDFQPKLTLAESNLWGTKYGKCTFSNSWNNIIDGVVFALRPYDRFFTGRFNNKGKPILENFQSSETVYPIDDMVSLQVSDSKSLGSFVNDGQAYLVVTEPPYGGMNYSELTDFFYVWLRLSLSKTYRCFEPELTPKAQEIIVNPTRGHTEEDFKSDLKAVFEESGRKLPQNGLLVFTFHHDEDKAWETLLETVCEAGFEINSIYPIQREIETPPHLLENKTIPHDLIHICRKRPKNQEIQSWRCIRREIRRNAREEIKAIEAGRYGKEPLSPTDVNIILTGKCLEPYTRYYGAVVDHEGKEVPLRQALKEIRMMVDQLVSEKQPLPSELADIDPESYVYLICLCNRKELRIDEVHKATRGILEPDSLVNAGIMTKGRAKKRGFYEVKQPTERFHELLEKFNPLISQDREQQTLKSKVYFIDYVHFLMALVEGGENIVPWLERFKEEMPRLKAACEYIMSRNKGFAASLKKILNLIDVGPLFAER